MCASMADILSATAEIRRGKNEVDDSRKHRAKYNGVFYSVHLNKIW